MSYLLDTNILIDFLRKHPLAATWMQGLERRAAVSVVSLAELLGGARRQSEEREIHQLVACLDLFPVNSEIASLAGAHKKHYGKSHSVELGDALIAATAEHHGLKLATLNVKHFPMFAKLKAPY